MHPVVGQGICGSVQELDVLVAVLREDDIPRGAEEGLSTVPQWSVTMSVRIIGGAPIL